MAGLFQKKKSQEKSTIRTRCMWLVMGWFDSPKLTV